MKKLIKWLLIVISVLAMIFLLLRLGFKIVYTIKPELGYSFVEDKAPKVKSIQSYGADRQYVSIGLDRGEIGIHYTSIDGRSLDLKRFLKFKISLHCNKNQPNHYLFHYLF